MADANLLQLRFEDGGTFEINDGTARNILQIVPGRFRFTPPRFEIIETKDRGIYNTPRQGDNTIGEIMLAVRADWEATGLYAIAMAAGTNGTPKLFTSIIAKQPDYRGASAGRSLTWSSTNIYLGQAPQYQASGGNDEMDTIEFTFRVHAAPVLADY